MLIGWLSVPNTGTHYCAMMIGYRLLAVAISKAYLLGVSSAALRRHRQLVGIFLELPQDVAHHFDEHQTLRLRQKVLGHL